MSKKLGQEPAYPVFLQDGLSHNSHVDCGISTRLHLASLAMQGYCANSKIDVDMMRDIAVMALEQADELLKQYENDN